MQPSDPVAPQPAAPLSPDEMLTDVDAARHLGVALQSVRNWRWKGTGPKYHRIGQRIIRYRRRDLDDFIARGASDKADAA